MSMKRTIQQNTGRTSMYSTGLSKGQSVVSRKGESEKKSLKPPVKLVDSKGNDYTPLPLLQDDRKVKDNDKDTPTDNISQGSFYTQSISSFVGTNPLAFTRSKSQQSSSGYTAESSTSLSDDLGEGIVPSLNTYTEVKTIKQEVSAVLKEGELDQEIAIFLQETDTMWIFDAAPMVFTRDAEESATIERKNQLYEALLSTRVGNDKYVERGMNTFDSVHISKSVQTAKIGHIDQQCLATVWDIYDSYNVQIEMEQGDKVGTDVGKDENIELNASPFATTAADNKIPHSEMATPDLQMTKGVLQSRTPTMGDRTQDTISAHSESELFGTRQSTMTSSSGQDSQAKHDIILNSTELRSTLFLMERALNMNLHFEKLLYYRDLPYFAELMQEMKFVDPQKTLLDEMADEEGRTSAEGRGLPSIRQSAVNNTQPHFELLWKYSTEFTKGRNISGMAWNRQNPDLLAVSYGEFVYSNQKEGIVCCWSLKNVQYPERIFKLPVGATAVSWSRSHSNLLAVGLFDGSIAVFDVRKKTDEPVVDTKHASGRHLGPVRQLEWVVKISGRSEEHSEMLVSISSDGRVTMWSIRKGFESSDLMKLKRIATRIPGAGKQRKTDALISQYASGCSFAFNPKDSNMYLVGVEEGHIHKCSCSYSEQYLENYFGHSAPVYEIQWSPFMNDVFLSCSADWTIKLWHIERQLPVASIQPAMKSVNAIAWSPKSSVIFACVNEVALEIWNLQVSTLDPMITDSICPETTVLTSVTFTESGNCLIVGDSDGVLHTFALRNMPPTPRNQAEILDKTIQYCIASQLQT